MERRTVLARLAQLGAVAALAPGVRAFQADRRTLPAPKLDAHAHLLSRDLVTWMQSASPDREIRRAVRPINGRIIVDALEEDGIDRAIVLSSACLHASDVSRGGRKKKPADEYRDVQNEHEFTAAQAAEYAPRLIPFASVNPKRDYAIAEFSRSVDRFRMRGLSVHFGESDVRLRDPQHLARVQELFGEAARRNLPVIAHIFNGEIEDFGTQDIEILIAKVVAPNPALRISIAHLGGSGGASEERTLRFFSALIQTVRAHPQVASQVWADCSSVLLTEARPGAKPISAAQKAALGVMLRNWGIDRLMWGSDTLTDRHPTSLEQARLAWPLTDEEWTTLAAFDGAGFLPRSGTERGTQSLAARATHRQPRPVT